MNELHDKESQTPGQVARAAWGKALGIGCVPWERVIGKACWESAAQAVLAAFGAQVSRQAIIDAWKAGWDALDVGSGQYDPAGYADSIDFAVLDAFCAPQPEPKAATISVHFTRESQRYPAPSGFSAMVIEPTLNEIRAMAAKHGMVLVEADLSARPAAKWYWEADVISSSNPVCAVKFFDPWLNQEEREPTPASLGAPLSAPDARFGGGK